MTKPNKLRVFVDADVLFSGAASPSKHSASLVVLRMAEITLIDAIASQQVVVEAECNLGKKLPKMLPAFKLIVDRCLQVVPDPNPVDFVLHTGSADPKDLPILVAALREGCLWLVTFNVRHFQPGHPDIKVVRPADLLFRIRDRLASLTSEGDERDMI